MTNNERNILLDRASKLADASCSALQHTLMFYESNMDLKTIEVICMKHNQFMKEINSLLQEASHKQDEL